MNDYLCVNYHYKNNTIFINKLNRNMIYNASNIMLFQIISLQIVTLITFT
jgi:hypothetical protein